jgi:tetratricopeptide (TPR) repeat protein
VNVARNEPCACGSGRKYKACCGRLAAAAAPEPHSQPQPQAHPNELAPLVALMESGRFAELEGRVRELLGARPESGFAWQLLGAALANQGKDALMAWSRAAQLMPEDPVSQLNLGNALARLGRTEEAQASFRRALDIRPDFAEAQQNLGKVLLDLGRSEEAAQSCRRALQIKPEFAEAHNTLGKAWLKLGNIDDATASFRRALDLRAEFAEARVNLGNALRSMGRLKDAIEEYRRALLIEPDFIAAHIELGTALRLQRRGAEAEASCRRALRINPDSPAALAVLADLQADTGGFAEAEQLFRRIIAIDPSWSEAWAGIARLRRMTLADTAWLTAALDLAERGLPPQRELSLRYAIGKYFDDVRDFEKAFENYRRANELSRQCGPKHDTARVTRNIDLIIRSHDQARLSRMRSAANPSTRPVFVVGMLRSGTSLAEQILASHPAVFGAGELTFWSAKMGAAIAGATAANASAIDVSGATLAGLGDRYLELLRGLSADALRVIDKLPTNFLCLGLIHAAFPHARIIHMRRNPIDTCLSIYFQRFEPANTYVNDLEDLAHYYREYRRLMRHWRSVLPPHCLLEVPYEGLTLDLPAWSRRMLEFIDLPWDARCLDFHETARTVVTASRWQVRQKISTSSVERWRHYEKYLGPLKSLREPGSQ